MSEAKVETLAIGATDQLVEIAVSSRPDVRAAELSVEAASRRLEWERSRTLGFVAPLLSSKGIGISGIKTGPGLILRGAEERLAPILMTALTTALALLPIVIGGNKPGQEIEHPMAVVIVGGLVTSTILNLLLMPVLYQSVAREAGPLDER